MRLNEPCMMPPPITRSSSSTPVRRRESPSISTAVSRSGAPCFDSPLLGLDPSAERSGTWASTSADSVSSTSVFQAPQPAHLPIHLWASWPHSWHT